MKKVSLILITVLMMATIACKKDKTTDPVTPPTSGSEELSGNLSTRTLDASKKYLLKGTVFVNDGQTLTIPAGTIIMGDKATKGCLLINVGGKIDAQGTATNPIIFTSAQPIGARDEGDWCGVILLGKANVNQTPLPSIEGISPGVSYGTYNSTANDADNSGIMKYCRIEFAGIALTPNNETNSLTFGAVGNGTQIDYIQSSFGGDDSFEWFGGTVKATHLVAYAGWDDDFDTDFGFSGKVQYAVGIRDPFQADQSGSNGFESDGEATGAAGITPLTSVVFANVTLLGPIFDSTKAVSGNFQNGMHIRRNSNLSVYNSVISGYTNLFNVQDNVTGTTSSHYAPAGSPTAVVSNNVAINLNRFGKTASSGGTATTKFLNAGSAVWNAAGQNNVLTTYASTELFNTALTSLGLSSSMLVGYSTYPANPNLAVTSGLLTSGATATVPTGINAETYIGAFGSTDWTDNWANFDPRNVAY